MSALARAFDLAQRMQRQARRADAPTPRAVRVVLADTVNPRPRDLRSEVLQVFREETRRRD